MSEIIEPSVAAMIDAPNSPAPVVEPSPAPIETPTPAPEDTSVTPPTEPAPVADPVVPAEPELYDLPDGRKVDAATLAHEWKNNFMPDYTRKSQIAAQVAPQAQQQQPPATQPQTTNAPQTPPWRDPNWVPQTYAEVIDAAKQDIQLDQARQVHEREQATAQINSMVDNQLAEIRKTEPNLSEDLLFQHALKYSFPDLNAAYKNMKDFNLAVKRTEARVQQNIQARAEDPVAVQTQQPSSSNEIDYRRMVNDHRSPLDILRGLKG